MPTVEQATSCVGVCQMLSNSYSLRHSLGCSIRASDAASIYVFRYDTNRKIVYIQAGTEVQTDEIEVEIAQSGLWRFIE